MRTDFAYNDGDELGHSKNLQALLLDQPHSRQQLPPKPQNQALLESLDLQTGYQSYLDRKKQKDEVKEEY